VRKDSPAYKAGLKKDDSLISINGKKTADMTMEKIMEMMKSDEGKTINMLIERKIRNDFKFYSRRPNPLSRII
jgi:C-terminal processing protease CtpA/Prc